ncbi:MAG: carboxypeptidase regulatory-like domain-containing protein [Planctomycetes bacterium]|nr:carboxypeptidase regulatory-like domain-containing protein [Planctomycetota bacterium]
MPKALIVLTVLVLILGIWLVKGQGGDFDRFGAQRQRKLAAQKERADEARDEVLIQGRLLDPDGRPLPDLLVELGGLDGAAGAAFVAEFQARSDDKGRFRFPVPTPAARRLRVTGRGGEQQVFEGILPSTNLDLRVARP